MSAADVVSEFGNEYAAQAFAAAGEHDALPVIIPAYNQSYEQPSLLPWTLASLARASATGAVAIRPLLIINGPPEGSVEETCADFGLRKYDHFIQYDFRGKVRALKAGVEQILDEEGYTGPFATTDDDAVVPSKWAEIIANRMSPSRKASVGGGTTKYYRVPEVSRSILTLRNVGNSIKERQAHTAGKLRAHGNNQWFTADEEGQMLQAFQKLNPNIGFGDDAAIVDAISAVGGSVMPIDLNRDAQILSAGDRSTRLSDLVRTALGRGESRYVNDASWSELQAYNS